MIECCLKGVCTMRSICIVAVCCFVALPSLTEAQTRQFNVQGDPNKTTHSYYTCSIPPTCDGQTIFSWTQHNYNNFIKHYQDKCTNETRAVQRFCAAQAAARRKTVEGAMRRATARARAAQVRTCRTISQCAGCPTISTVDCPVTSTSLSAGDPCYCADPGGGFPLRGTVMP
jgi:hypothetical protein